MTLKKLDQLRYMRKLIDHERDRLEDLRASLGPRSPALSGMPGVQGGQDKIGMIVPNIVDGEREIEDQISQLEQEEAAIMQWIRTAPPDIQLICRLRFCDNESWDEIAGVIDTGNGRTTADSVKSLLYRYLKRWNIEHPEDDSL